MTVCKTPAGVTATAEQEPAQQEQEQESFLHYFLLQNFVVSHTGNLSNKNS